MSCGKATNGAIRELIVKLFYQGKTFRDIAKQINVAKSTESDIVKKYGETGLTQISRHGAGRPRKVTSRMQRSLVRICKTYRRSTVREITAKWNEETIGNVSRETCLRWIHKSGLHFYKAKETPLLTEKQKERRLAWAKERAMWTFEDWKRIIFSDESKFDVCVGDHRSRVIRNKNEAFHKDCLKRKIKFPSGVMVWGSMSGFSVGNLHFIDGIVNAEKYQNILETNLLVSIPILSPDGNFTFQQDGASYHTAKTTRKWLQDNKISVLDWPSSSPDLNINETVWHKMKQL